MKAVIFGCSGETLTEEEKSFFERVDPLGFILFERNCKNPTQLKALTTELRNIIGRADVPILIDQEGGRISRLSHMYWRVPPKPGDFGELYEIDPDASYQAVYDNALLIAYDLMGAGINVNCSPIADLPTADADPIIGDRSYSAFPEVTSSLCLAMIQGLQDMGITPILKHFPGHGRATLDSHKQLPVITASLTELHEYDLNCFKEILISLNQLLRPLPWGMTAHIVYTAVDPENPATFSSKVIDNIIRGYLDFQGFLVSDCLTMNALSGTMGERAERAILAGCNAVLHCSGDLHEMIDVATSTPDLDDHALELLEDSKPLKTYATVQPAELEMSVKKAFDASRNLLHTKRM